MTALSQALKLRRDGIGQNKAVIQEVGSEEEDEWSSAQNSFGRAAQFAI